MRPPAFNQATAAMLSGVTAELKESDGLKFWNHLLNIEFLNESIELLLRFLARNGHGVRGPFKLKK
jgi:hypothetical protein